MKGPGISGMGTTILGHQQTDREMSKEKGKKKRKRRGIDMPRQEIEMMWSRSVRREANQKNDRDREVLVVVDKRCAARVVGSSSVQVSEGDNSGIEKRGLQGRID